MHRKRRSNRNVYRLIKQVKSSKQDWKDFKLVKPLRSPSYENQIFDMIWYDYPKIYKPQKSWKKHRKTQFKAPVSQRSSKSSLIE